MSNLNIFIQFLNMNFSLLNCTIAGGICARNAIISLTKAVNRTVTVIICLLVYVGESGRSIYTAEREVVKRGNSRPPLEI
jgi:hypothetical protein